MMYSQIKVLDVTVKNKMNENKILIMSYYLKMLAKIIPGEEFNLLEGDRCACVDPTPMRRRQFHQAYIPHLWFLSTLSTSHRTWHPFVCNTLEY